MSKKGTKALASATLMSLVLTTALSAGPVKAAQGSVTRIGAADRYATAAQVATSNWKDGAKDVVLVSGEGYADAVSASALAKKLNAPILLTTAGSLNADAKAALATLKPTNVYVVGGNASVSAAVRSDLKAANYTLVELQGANRYETNVAVAKKLVELGVKADNVLLVGGEGFSDALSVAPVAAAKDQILLLGNNNEDSMKSVIDFVKANSSKVTVVGTSNVISDAIYTAVGAVDRVNGGASRFETNINVLNKFAADLKADKLYVANASGNGYADALVASALAGKSAAPLVLVDAEGTTATNNAITYIKGKATKTTDLNVVGGLGVVSQATADAIQNAVNPKPDTNNTSGENTVADVTGINLNQFEVTFNCNIDEDTAELPQNYKVAGTDLSATNAHVEKVNDNTVRVTLVKSKFTGINQNDEKTVTVKKGILTDDKTRTIEKADKKVTFKDVEAPTLKSVSVKGNNKLVVEFSEAVNMYDLGKVADLIQINGKNLPTYNSTLSTAKEATAADSDNKVWANKVEFYFNSKLSSGENTVKVKDAKDGMLVDAAGFSFKEAEETVTIDEVTTKPTIQEIKATDNGKIYIKFDRAMDTKTVANKSNYSINDTALPSAATVELDDDDATDSTIKIKNVGDILKDNTNVLEIQDGLKDAYGNKIEDDTRKSFDKEKDETKPTVLSATVIDNTTLRVQFSEDVKYNYATNVDNYELKDSSDVDVMHTDKSKIKIVASNATSSTDYDNTDTYDIKFNATSTKLDSSKYTLTVKNIVDIANEPNKMDDQTLDVDGDSDEAPSLDDISAFKKSGSTTEVAIYFGKEMDGSSLRDKANYFYINGDGDSEELPDDVDITVSSDNKSVVLDFDDANKTINPSATSGDEYVKKIGVKTAKDANGNELYVGSLTIDPSSTTGPKFETDTLTLAKDGDDVIATIQLDTPLDDEYAADFVITSKTDSTVKVVADSIESTSKKVTLTFNEGTNADAVMALGTDAQLTTIASPKSDDIAGRALTGSQVQQVYYYGIAPETDRDNYAANITVDSTGKVTGATVSVKLKTKVDQTMKSAYLDDFEFTYNGSNLDATDVSFNGTTLVFTIDPTEAAKIDLTKNNDLGISVTTDESDIDLRSPKDQNGDTVKFVPSSDDKKVKTVTISKTTVAAPAATTTETPAATTTTTETPAATTTTEAAQ